MSVQLATFHVGDYMFGVPVQVVQEVLRHQEITRVPLAPDSVGGLINLRGQVVTALDLRHRLGFEPADAGQLPMNVVTRVNDGAVSLLVDSIGDVVETDDTLFEPPPETLAGPGRGLIRGAYKLDDQLLLALDVARVVDIESAA